VQTKRGDTRTLASGVGSINLPLTREPSFLRVGFSLYMAIRLTGNTKYHIRAKWETVDAAVGRTGVFVSQVGASFLGCSVGILDGCIAHHWTELGAVATGSAAAFACCSSPRRHSPFKCAMGILISWRLSYIKDSSYPGTFSP
jgi:hypothetical protein